MVRKIYVGILILCYWIQKKTVRRPMGFWWRHSARLGAWAARRAQKIDEHANT